MNRLRFLLKEMFDDEKSDQMYCVVDQHGNQLGTFFSKYGARSYIEQFGQFFDGELIIKPVDQ